MASYSDSRKRSDKFNPEIIALLYKVNPKFHSIKEASEHLDCNEATDLILNDSIRMALRVRTFACIKYKGQFTVRTTVFNNLNELRKILRGDVRYMFYAFADPTDKHILCWWVLDLNVFRSADLDQVNWEMQNCKKRGEFYAYTISDFERFGKFIVAQG